MFHYKTLSKIAPFRIVHILPVYSFAHIGQAQFVQSGFPTHIKDNRHTLSQAVKVRKEFPETWLWENSTSIKFVSFEHIYII